MTVDRSEGHVEVVSYNSADVRPVTVAYRTETIMSDPYATRGMQVFKFQQVIFLLFGILEALLGIRFVLGLLAANPAAGFAQLIYGLTGPFLAPFAGLFGQPNFEGMVFEWNALVAILVYALLAGLLVKLAVFTMGYTRRDTYSSTTTRIDSL
jgi:hypothetical protein